MRLKSLEIKGFKSFADKTTIHFNNNMTGIVGPNGCGKSNTVDAIRWVLGEQKSKNLRLEKMDNLIFNGTKKRKAANRAEVMLTFENTRNLLPTDYTTITISRILYRNGSSEYRLNNVRCRLKDINTLFMDTGISSDSYAIIELKMIDEILNNKDNSRRKLFEQAAGISKYKNRKKETLSKLTATDADLNRVEDLLFEIEKNLKSLERQAKRTQRYYKLREQYKELSIELALHHLVNHKEIYRKLQQQQQAEEQQQIAIEATIAQYEAALAQKKVGVIETEKKLSLAQKDLNEHSALIREVENDRNLLNQNNQYLQKNEANLKQQIHNDTHLLGSLAKEVTHLQDSKIREEQNLERLQKHLAGIKAEVDILKQEYNKQKAELEKRRTEYRQVERQTYDIEKKMAVKRAQKDNFIREIQDNRLRFESRQEELEAQEDQIRQFYEEEEVAKNKLHELVTEESFIQQEIAKLSQNIENEQHTLNQLNRQLDAKRNEYKLTKSLVDSLEGFPDSVKYLKKNTAWQTKENQRNSDSAPEVPLLLDLINCAEDYKVAMENYLKPYLNHYVVENMEAATAAIKLLHQHQKGKANFFIISELKYIQFLKKQLFPLSTSYFSQENDKYNIVSALEIIDIQEKYKKLFYFLLHNVFFAPNDYHITQVDLPENAILVLKNGKVIRQKAMITGGSVGAFEGRRIGQRQRLAQLEQEIQQQTTEIQLVQTKVQSARNAKKQLAHNSKSKANWIRQQNRQLQKISHRIASLQSKIENAQTYMEDFDQQNTKLEIRLNTLQKEINELNIQLSELRIDRQQQKSQIEAQDRTFRQKSQQLGSLRQLYNSQNIEFHKQQNRISNVLQNVNFKIQQQQTTKEQLVKNEQELATISSKVDDNQSVMQEIVRDLKHLYTEKEDKEQQLNVAEEQYYTARGEVDTIDKETRLAQKNKQQVVVLLTEIKEKMNQLRIELLSLKERLAIEFKVDINDIIEQEPSAPLTKMELIAKVKKLKKQIEKFGNINPMAVEAYQEMKERYDFIVAQRNDLLDAKKSLLKTIQEIEEKATTKFMDAFNKIRSNFMDVFRSLFTQQDQCDLLLTEPNNPLDSTIDIIAKPKGKRPQSINQLSGGEKSLTALALVFSLYLFKPAPFCILDEVDAPLDDVNVDKFTSIIREFSKDSQFIIVTHNKNTMASVDVIYGVTMQENGVSKVIPADFRTLALN